ncbi:helix-turn-helix domain-containing protein [Piscinibacter sp.]|uniref:helix-turn-helix domain-containing protein n=1 Tax=Piscinibacter sp. TaxID=1903157 RepID=UPI0039E70772
MSDPSVDKPAAASAGALIRQARQAQGLHIAALAASIKVPQRKLEALEADRFDELPDATFTRALAQTVCRSLKVDPAPVLALLPQPAGHRLEHVAEGINAPFRERPGAAAGADWSLLGSPAVWAPLLILLLAAVVYFLPKGTVTLPTLGGAASAPGTATSTTTPPPADTAPAEQSAPAAEAAASVVVETVHSAPAAPDAAASTPGAAAEVAGVLQLRASAESWVEVLDARGATLLSRLLQPGETVGIDGAAPFKLTIGNAAATQLTFRGKAVELPAPRDNVARLELK